jgi:protein-S-isoprenylcysteine O-methyltransferase Ste14
MYGKKVKISSGHLPKSVTSIAINLVGLTSFCFVIYLVRINNINSFIGGILAGLAICVPIIILELISAKTFKNHSTGLDFSKRNPFNSKRVLVKLVGLYATLALFAFFYWIFPEYHTDFYLNYWSLVKIVLPIIIIGSIPYFFILDRFLVEPEEIYWQVGMIVLGNYKQVSKKGLKNYLLGWLVKAFYLPLMYTFLCGNISFIKDNAPFMTVVTGHQFSSFFNYMNNFLYTIDLAWVFVGYLLTLRIFDSHIRTVEPSFLGWFVAIQCYQPFWNMVSPGYYAYDDGYDWSQWLSKLPEIYIFWGTIILILVGIYVWASIAFGIRFSNLTHRGILTNGPYRYMKHPAYVCKNLSWWLVSIPFISTVNFADACQHCLLLLFLNFIYFLRARTEERHLSKDPTYVQYGNVMNEISIFRGLFKRFPALSYNAARYQNNKLF